MESRKRQWVPFLGRAGSLPSPLRSIATRVLRWRLGAELKLSPEEFRGKRILILGPASTLATDLAGLDPADFDVVVKTNNGLDTPVAWSTMPPLRCDVLFHSLTEDARPVTPQKLRDAGVAWLVHRTATRGAFLDTVLAARRFGNLTRVRFIDPSDYAALSTRLGGASPTTGLVCCAFFLHAPVRRVAIAGFTFFATRYHPGYDDSVLSDADATRRIADKGHHVPAREALLVQQFAEEARERGVCVTLAPGVAQAIRHCTQVGM